MTGKMCAVAALLAGLWAGSAQAALVISTAATSNVNCSGGVCTATAANAVLNAHDLMVFLVHGDTTLASGSTAQDIEFDTPKHWTSAHTLTLDSYRSITFTQPVMSEGTGGITITTNDGGTAGDVFFTGKGRVVFWNVASSLVINGQSYILVSNITTLASHIAASASGNYALANNYDASVDGTYFHSPVTTNYSGTFEGLGNTIAHLTLQGSAGGFFQTIFVGGSVRDLNLMGEVISVSHNGNVGGLVALNDGAITGVSIIGGSIFTRDTGIGAAGGVVGENCCGTILRSHSSARVSCSHCWAGGLVGENISLIIQSSATGMVKGGNNAEVGGLVGRNQGEIHLSFATGSASTLDSNFVSDMAGGLVGSNEGIIDQCFATGAASGGSGIRHPANHVWVGGLAGNSTGAISRSYSTGSATVGDQGYVGGLAGAGALSSGGFEQISQSYSTDVVSGTSGTSSIGGFIGDDTGSRAPNADTYWDLDTSSISDPSKGAGNKANDPGITGLTTAQFQSGLPAGFDPTIWGESAGINNGLPYLLALQPQ